MADRAESMLGGPLAPGATGAERNRALERARRLGSGELVLYMAILLTIAALRVGIVGGPYLSNDSYQYLSIAENLSREGSIATSIVHFDAERIHGRIPAPEATFPPGYSVMMWFVSRAHVPLEWAGLLVSLVAALAVLPLLRSGAYALGIAKNAARVCLVIWTFSAQVALYAISVLTESAFTAFSFAAVVLLLWSVRDPDPPLRRPLAFLLMGLSCWLRYAGLFFVAALHVWAVSRLLARRARVASWLASLAACDIVVVLLLLRNVAVSGSWSGGHSDGARQALETLAYRLYVSTYDLALGSHQRLRSFPLGAFALLMGAGAAVAIVTIVAARRHGVVARHAGGLRQLRLLGLSVTAYCAAILYTAWTSNISLESARMFLPVIPQIALLAAVFTTGVKSPLPRRFVLASTTGFSLCLTGYVGANVASDVHPPTISRHKVVEAALALPMADGQPLSAWIQANIPPDAIVFSVDGQATGYVLKRRMLSAVGRAYSRTTWSADEVQRTMSRFGAEYLIVYPEIIAASAAGATSDHLDTTFFRNLVSVAPPPWLELAARNSRVILYRRLGQHAVLGTSGRKGEP